MPRPTLLPVAALSLLLLVPAAPAADPVRSLQQPEVYAGCRDVVECFIEGLPLPDPLKMALLNVYRAVRDVVCVQSNPWDPRVGVYQGGACDAYGPRDFVPLP